MRDYALPSHDKCLAIIRDCHVPLHILRHSKTVARFGVFLAKELIRRGVAVDVELVERACLLHDIFRVCEFPLEDFSTFEQPVTEDDKAKWRALKERHAGTRHEDAACAFLRDAYPVLAETIRKHRYTAIVHEDDKPRTWEEKLVYYADKRVMHDNIVPLRVRLDEAHKRHAARKATTLSDADILAIDAAILRLEAEIFARIGLDPDTVISAIVNP
jgi:uncharacterized protein